jgi:hypothetical protein
MLFWVHPAGGSALAEHLWSHTGKIKPCGEDFMGGEGKHFMVRKCWFGRFFKPGFTDEISAIIRVNHFSPPLRRRCKLVFY